VASLGLITVRPGIALSRGEVLDRLMSRAVLAEPTESWENTHATCRPIRAERRIAGRM